MESSKAKCIIFVNQKGGTGKTTSCLAIAGHLVKSGAKVLLVDMDPQANATLGLGFSKTMIQNSMYDSILTHCKGYEGTPITEVIITTKIENLHLAPSESDLSVAEILIQNSPDRTNILNLIIENIINLYDYILIDPPSHLGLLTLNSLRVCNSAVIPMDPGIFSLSFLENFKNYCLEMYEITGHNIEEITVVMNRYIKTNFISSLFNKANPSQDMKEALHKINEKFFIIPESNEVYYAHKAGLPVSHYAPASDVSKAYLKIAEALAIKNPEPRAEA
ncbi:chromosome partitioning protein [Candidatus Magnetomoraceae bacterium gMMP-15]